MSGRPKRSGAGQKKASADMLVGKAALGSDDESEEEYEEREEKKARACTIRESA